MSTLDIVTRSALVAALLGQGGVLIWIAVQPTFAGQPALLIAIGLAPLLAAGLLFVRRGIGAALALVASLIGGLIGLFLSACFLCGSQVPAPPEAIALVVASMVGLGLALLEITRHGPRWVIVPIAVVLVVLANNLIGAGLVVAAAILWLLVKRRSERAGRNRNVGGRTPEVVS
jgi:hypothetical protein